MAPVHSETHLVFVYGTLKRGGSNHGFLAGQTYLGEATLAPGHTLYLLNDYPGIVPAPGCSDQVTGELWLVDAAALVRLDTLEGVDEGLYARVPAPLASWPAALSAEAVASTKMYLYLRDVSAKPRLGATWYIE